MNKKTISLEDLIEQSADQNFVDVDKNLSGIKQETSEEIVKRDMFFVPRLDINKPEYWPNNPNKKHFLPVIAEKTCLGNCSGVEGLKSGCCKLNPDDIEHVLGPCDEKWIKTTKEDLYKKFGVRYSREDIVIDYEEGKKIGEKYFNNHPVFKNRDAYPILRMQLAGTNFACKFLNLLSGKCSIYELRPEFCRGYYCNYIKANFLVVKQGTQTQYVDLRKEPKKEKR